MMTPKSQENSLQEARRMRGLATPAKTKRLLEDIARLPVNEASPHDA